MARTEERIFDVNGRTLRITADVLIGQDEELFLPGGRAVPSGRQEMIVGIKTVHYNSTPGGERSPQWEVFDDVDVGSLLSELKALRVQVERLKKENVVYRRRLKAFGFGQEEEEATDAEE